MEQPLAPEIAPAPTTTPPRPTTPRDPLDVLQQILTGLGIEAKVVYDAPKLMITTAEPGRLIGKHGQTLSQLQFLVNRILFRHDPNAPRVTLDCDGPRDQAPAAAPVPPNDELLNNCTEAANKVRRWGDEVQIGPFTATERQAIHDHFARDVEVEPVTEPGDETARKKIILRIRQTPLRAPGQARR